MSCYHNHPLIEYHKIVSTQATEKLRMVTVPGTLLYVYDCKVRAYEFFNCGNALIVLIVYLCQAEISHSE